MTFVRSALALADASPPVPYAHRGRTRNTSLCAPICDVLVVSLRNATSDDQITRIDSLKTSLDAPAVLLVSHAMRGEFTNLHDTTIASVLTRPTRGSHLAYTLSTLVEGAVETSPAKITKHAISEAETTSRLHIVLAENNAVNQTISVKMLEKPNQSVDVAKNAARALEALQAQRYNLVLIYCQLEEMDRFAATHKFVRSPFNVLRHANHADECKLNG